MHGAEERIIFHWPHMFPILHFLCKLSTFSRNIVCFYNPIQVHNILNTALHDWMKSSNQNLQIMHTLKNHSYLLTLTAVMAERGMAVHATMGQYCYGDCKAPR